VGLQTTVGNILAKAGFIPREWARPTVGWDQAAMSRHNPATRREMADLVGRYHGYVYRCVNLNATAVAQGRLRLYQRQKPGGSNRATKSVEFEGVRYSARGLTDARKSLFRKFAPMGSVVRKSIEDDANVVEIDDESHPLVALLNRPSPGMSLYDMIEALQIHLEITGSAFLLKYVPGEFAHPVQLWPLMSQHVRPIIEVDRGIVGYKYGREYGKEVVFTSDEVVYFKNYNPNDPFSGRGWVSAALAAADLSFTIDQFKQEYLDNGAHPSLVLSVDGPMTPEHRQRNEAAIESWYTGVRKAGKIMQLSGKMSATFATGEKELPFILTDDQARDKIATISGVPKSLITTDDVNLANGSVALPHWHVISIIPKRLKLTNILNETLVPMFGEDLILEFDPPDLGEPDKDEARVRANWMADLTTLDEARAVLGFDSDPEMGELRYSELRAASQPTFGGGLFGPAPPPSSPSTPPAPTKPEQGDTGGKIDIKPAAAKSLPEAPKIVLVSSLWGHKSGCGCGSCKTVNGMRDGASLAVKRFDPQDRLARQFGLSVSEWYTQLSRAVGDRVMAGQTEFDDQFVRQMAESLKQATDRAFRATLEAAYRFGGDELDPSRLPDGLSFDRPPERVLAALDNYELRFSLEASRNAADRIKSELQVGLELGETTQELTNRVQMHLSGENRWASERIARTETSRMEREGRLTAWKESGIVSRVEWVLSARPCELCRAIASKVNQVPLGQPFVPKGGTVTGDDGTVFVMDYEDVTGHPAHPGCWCDTRAVFAD
jgi:HK97 family phage portal protein